MAFALITLTTSLVLNLTVLALLKIGLRSAPTSDELTGCQSC
ncbi:MAG TPA: hypothetical protein VGE08_10825 [Steroidobacter sp.]